MQVVNWPSLAFRVFAIANFILAGVGLLILAPVAIWVLVGPVGNTPAQPHFLQAFWTMTAANMVLLDLLILGGILLLQRRTSGVVVCSGVFVAEILYFIAIAFFWSEPYSASSVSVSVAAATGVGNAGLAPQLLCAYPLVALVCLNLARQRLKRQKTVALAL